MQDATTCLNQGQLVDLVQTTFLCLLPDDSLLSKTNTTYYT